MSWFSRLWNVFRADRVSAEIDREIAFHVAERTDDLVAAGLSPAEAQREARRRFGNYGLQKESTRDQDVAVWLDTLRADVLYALRALRAAPGFALVAILSLALGIGANTAIFTLINTVMLKSLPVRHPEELVVVTMNGDEGSVTHALWEQIRDRQEVLAEVSAFASTGVDLSNGGEARRESLAFVSGGFFGMLGVRSAVGRSFTEADDRPGCPAVAVISHGFWQSEYDGNANVIGKAISLDGHPFEIVGATEPGFFSLEFGYHVPIWVPICTEAIVRGAASGNDSRMGRQVFGRLKSGVTVEQANAHFVALGPSLVEATTQQVAASKGVRKTKEQYRSATFGARSFSKGVRALSRSYGKALFTLMAVVGVVLLVACANVANLLLARAIARQREVAIRLALGASRMRLIRQLLTESLVLSLLGAGVGLLFARWGSQILVASLARNISLELAPDARVLGFTIATGTLTGLLFGLAPAWRAAVTEPHTAMKPSSRGVAERYSRFSVGQALVVGQVALSLVMVTTASLLLGSWRRLATFDAGFERDRVLLVTVDTRAAGVPDDQRNVAFARVVERLRALPGVDTVSAAVRTPIGPISWNTVINVDGFVSRSDGDVVVQMNVVSAGYFATFGTPILAGRDFSDREAPGSPGVVIVSEALARKFFGGLSAVGHRVRFGREAGPPIEIIGIAADVKQSSLREPGEPIVYFPVRQDPAPGSSITFAVRARNSPSSLAGTVKAAIAALHPRYSMRVITLEEQVNNSIRLPRTLGVLSGFFGALALLLAMIGLYGIMSYTVARRRKEIGVRIALGAARTRIIRMVLGDVGVMVAVGIGIGTLLSLALTRLVAVFLYGVEPNDPATLAISALTLVAAAIGASMMPAQRAARSDPVAALRAD